MSEGATSPAEAAPKAWGKNSDDGVDFGGTAFAAIFGFGLTFLLCIILACKRLPVRQYLREMKEKAERHTRQLAYLPGAGGSKVHPGGGGP